MGRIFFIVLMLLLKMVPALPASSTASSTASTAMGAAMYWGAYIPGVPWDVSKLDAFERASGKALSIVHWGQPWMMNGELRPFQTELYDAVRAHGSIPMVSWGSWVLGAGPAQPDFQLRDIYTGQYDTYIQQWAVAAKAWGHPFFLRFDHEMNGWWQFPWSVQLNGNQPGDYVLAWRHVHDIFTQVGATNVTWVWCPNIVSANTTPLAQLYPGNAYVDWVAMDGYNWGSDRGNVWQNFNSIFLATYTQLTALAPTKPIMIAEMASSEDGGPLGSPASKAAWITDAMQVQLLHFFPRIKAVLWFDWNDDDPTLEWPIDSSPASVAAWASSIASPYYASSDFAQLPNSPIPVLLPQGFVPLTPAAQAIQPGHAATYHFYVIDSLHVNNTLTVTVGNLPPALSGKMTPLVLTAPNQITLTLTDTHPTGSLPIGLVYQIPITVSGVGFTQSAVVNLLVGGSRVYLPAVVKNN